MGGESGRGRLGCGVWVGGRVCVSGWRAAGARGCGGAGRCRYVGVGGACEVGVGGDCEVGVGGEREAAERRVVVVSQVGVGGVRESGCVGVWE